MVNKWVHIVLFRIIPFSYISLFRELPLTYISRKIYGLELLANDSLFHLFLRFQYMRLLFFTIYGFKSRLYGLIFYFWLAKAHRKHFITKKRQVRDFTRLQADQINHWWTLLGIFVVVMSLSVQHPFPWNPTKSLTLWTVSSLARLQTAELQPGIRNSYPVMMTQDTP